MKSKKGFTLVELLAVIAILAILVIIALPNILNLYRNARKNTFVDEVQNIVRTAQQKYIEDSMSNGSNLCYDSKTNPLEIDAKSSLNYKVQLSQDGKITSIQVLDNNYQLIKTNETDIKRDSIKSNEVNSRDKNQGLTDCKGNPIVEGTTTEPEPEQGIQYTSMLKTNPFNRFYIEYDYNIESIKFVNTNSVPDGVDGYEDVSSNDNSGDIMMWWTDTDEDELYEVTIGGQGGVRANTDSSSLFKYMSSVTTIDLTYLDTSGVTDMSDMFMNCTDLQSIIFGKNFNTSNVENMSSMFRYCKNLKTLDLSNFDTSNVTNMSEMFAYWSDVTILDLSNFTINEEADLSCMFGGIDDLDIESTGLPNYVDLEESLECSY